MADLALLGREPSLLSASFVIEPQELYADDDDDMAGTNEAAPKERGLGFSTGPTLPH